MSIISLYSLYNIAKDNDKILRCIREIEQSPEDFSLWKRIGEELLNNDSFDSSIECFDRSLNLSPDNPETLTKKGIALMNIGKFSESIECFDRSLNLSPDNPETLKSIAKSLALVGKYRESLRYYNLCISKKITGSCIF